MNKGHRFIKWKEVLKNCQKFKWQMSLEGQFGKRI